MRGSAQPRGDSESRRRLARRALRGAACALFLLLLLPRMLAVGMFFDGVTYAAVARNLALGIGSFWQPHYTQTIYPAFCEQPPLGLWLQSLAFRLCGDSAHVESFYGLGAGLLLLLLLSGLWRALGMQRRAGAWLPILLLAVYPLTSWILASNMLESTMTLFTTAAVLVALLAVGARLAGRQILGGLLAGGLVAAAVLTKGPVGVFPLAVPALALLLTRRPSLRSVIRTMTAMLGALVLVGALIGSSPAAREGLRPYIENQLLAHLSGDKGHAVFSLRILRILVLDTIAPLALAGLLWLVAGRNSRPCASRTTGLLLAIGLVASLPILLSPYQMKWYLFPSLPFFALAIAQLLISGGEGVERWLVSVRGGIAGIRALAFALFAVALIWMGLRSGHVQKYRDFHEELAPLASRVAPGARISVCPASLESDWALVANCARHLRVSLTRESGHRYRLQLRDADCSVPSSYRELTSSSARRFRLLESN